MSLYLGNNLVSGVATPTEPTRNLGQIIESLVPLTDAGLHLLDGALIDGSGIYSAFVTHIAGLVSSYPDLFDTEANWQQSITDYGVCGKFVYDSTNNTVRLPKVTGILEGTTDLTALGDLIEAGLPSLPAHTHTFTRPRGDQNYSNGSGNVWWGGSSNVTVTTADATWSSSSIYGNSTTVQPQAIKAFYYIVIATTTKTEIEVDIDEIATDLNGKVNIADLQEVQCVVETYQNGTSWYRVYSDGWCEQGGQATVSGDNNAKTINLLKSYKDINYVVFFTRYNTSAGTVSGAYVGDVCLQSVTTSSFSLNRGYNSPVRWQACGYIEV